MHYLKILNKEAEDLFSTKLSEETSSLGSVKDCDGSELLNLSLSGAELPPRCNSDCCPCQFNELNVKNGGLKRSMSLNGTALKNSVQLTRSLSLGFLAQKPICPSPSLIESHVNFSNGDNFLLELERSRFRDVHVTYNNNEWPRSGSESSPMLPQPVSSGHTVLPKEVALSCSGCGFLGTYHFGVMICFQRNAKRLVSRITRYAGASAGSLVATLMAVSPDSLEDGLAKLYELADELNTMRLGALTPGFYLNERLSGIVNQFLPDDVSRADGRLFVSLTNQKEKTNKLVSHFPNREYLVKALMASCFIPMYSMGYYAQAPELDGVPFIDGGYTNNLPTFEDIPTITVSPFSGSAMIAPQDKSMFEWRMTLGSQMMKVNMQNIVRGAQALFPPTSNVLHAYYEMGYRDGLKFLLTNGLLERGQGTEL